MPCYVQSTTDGVPLKGKEVEQKQGLVDEIAVEIAEDGFDPSTSGLWAQHASAAPLCSTYGEVWLACVCLSPPWARGKKTKKGSLIRLAQQIQQPHVGTVSAPCSNLQI